MTPQGEKITEFDVSLAEMHNRMALPKELLENFNNTQIFYLPLKDFKLSGMDYVWLEDSAISRIEDDYYIACLSPLEDEKPRSAINRLLGFLKLFKAELPFVNVCLDFTGPGAILNHYIPWDCAIKPPPFILRREEQGSFTKEWEQFGKNQYESFSILRFIGVDFEPYYYDMLIYLVEALESLLCPETKTEVSFKFASRGALILGQKKSSKDKKELFAKLKKAYNYRSKITHGGDYHKIPYKDYVPFLREKTRECIRFFRSHGVLDDAIRRREIIEDLTIFNVRATHRSDCGGTGSAIKYGL